MESADVINELTSVQEVNSRILQHEAVLGYRDDVISADDTDIHVLAVGHCPSVLCPMYRNTSPVH